MYLSFNTYIHAIINVTLLPIIWLVYPPKRAPATAPASPMMLATVDNEEENPLLLCMKVV